MEENFIGSQSPQRTLVLEKTKKKKYIHTLSTAPCLNGVQKLVETQVNGFIRTVSVIILALMTRCDSVTHHSVSM
jgi:hypothetical protein